MSLPRSCIHPVCLLMHAQEGSNTDHPSGPHVKDNKPAPKSMLSLVVSLKLVSASSVLFIPHIGTGSFLHKQFSYKQC